MADKEIEEFSNSSSGQILGFLLKVVGGGVGALVIAGIYLVDFINQTQSSQ